MRNDIEFKAGDTIRFKSKEEMIREGVDRDLIEKIFNEKIFEREHRIDRVGLDENHNDEYYFDDINMRVTRDELIPAGSYERYLRLRGLYGKKI